VELSTAEEVSKALGKDKEQLRDQPIEVTKMGATGMEQDGQGQEQPAAQQGAGGEQGALRMRGLPYSATKEDIMVRMCARVRASRV
jgi:hypothetical protein